MEYQIHFLLASIIKENFVAWLFYRVFFSLPPTHVLYKEKALLMGWKGRRFWRSRLWVNFPLIALFSAFRKENQRLFSTSPLQLMPPNFRNEHKRDVKHTAFQREGRGPWWGFVKNILREAILGYRASFPRATLLHQARIFVEPTKIKKSHGVSRDNTKARSGCSQNMRVILHSLDNSSGRLIAVGNLPPAGENNV